MRARSVAGAGRRRRRLVSAQEARRQQPTKGQDGRCDGCVDPEIRRLGQGAVLGHDPLYTQNATAPTMTPTVVPTTTPTIAPIAAAIAKVDDAGAGVSSSAPTRVASSSRA